LQKFIINLRPRGTRKEKEKRTGKNDFILCGDDTAGEAREKDIEGEGSEKERNRTDTLRDRERKRDRGGRVSGHKFRKPFKVATPFGIQTLCPSQ
jgi:hypothetical protein